MGQPVPGADGADGLNCWDANGNGVGDAEEDLNGDGEFDALDCQGPAGFPGAPGGSGGADGLNCWDANGNGVGDAAEDVNGDGRFDTLDCAGLSGGSGGSGPPGPPGADGPAFFNIFIDDFFGFFRGEEVSLPVQFVRIVEPFLGNFLLPRTAGCAAGFQCPDNAIAYRVAVPQRYHAGNDVTMRIYFYRVQMDSPDDCFIFSLDARRLRDGSGIEVYGDRRFIRVDLPFDLKGPLSSGATAGFGEDGNLVVVDLPINTPEGLDFPNDLSAADFLAFELNTARFDGATYEILGIEFTESPSGSARLADATIFGLKDELICECSGIGPDCNDNGIPDDCEIEQELTKDCNGNGVPDECDIALGREATGGLATTIGGSQVQIGGSQDCNNDGVPDECQLFENDCNEDGIPDDCQLYQNDCNKNGIPDDCDGGCP